MDKKPTAVLPIFWTIVGSSFLIILLLICYLIAQKVDSNLLTDVVLFTFANLGVVFLAGLLAGYAWYFAGYRKTLVFITPILSAAAIVMGVWFGFGFLELISARMKLGALLRISWMVQGSTFLLFIILTGFGYIKLLSELIKSK